MAVFLFARINCAELRKCLLLTKADIIRVRS